MEQAETLALSGSTKSPRLKARADGTNKYRQPNRGDVRDDFSAASHDSSVSAARPRLIAIDTSSLWRKIREASCTWNAFRDKMATRVRPISA